MEQFTGRANIKLYNQDCMPALEAMGENEFDLAIVDPPYGINIKQRVFKDNKKWDEQPPDKKYFDFIFNISKNQIIWGGNYFVNYLYPTKCYLIWDKKITDNHTFSMSEMAWTSFNTKAMTFYSPPPGERGFYNIDGKRIHPTQKPIKLYKWLLKNYANEGDTILDTHLGSGSIAIACWDMGFDLVGYEIDEDYFKKGVERVRKHTNQMQLF
jgi:site-specific DNA-methyltransferase (adenine-specific)